ncbi:hypothetical protein JCM10449v2_003676 [Rhodotorula kratochvilovae]
MLGLNLLQSATRALRAPLARPCLCRSALPSSSSPTLRLLSTSAPRPSPWLASTAAPFLLQRAATPAAAPVGQVRTFKMPRCMRKKASPLARNGGAGKAARKHSARAAKRRRQRSKKIN